MRTTTSNDDILCCTVNINDNVISHLSSSMSSTSKSLSSLIKSDNPQIPQFFFVELEVARLFFALSAASSSPIDEPLNIWFFCL